MSIEYNPLAKHCKGCAFLSKHMGTCDYWLIMDKLRPCPGGKDCTVKTAELPEGAARQFGWDVERGQQMWKNGATDAEIARTLRVSIATVKSYRSKKWGAPNYKEGESRGGATVQWDTRKGLELWLKGASDREVAEAVGATQTAVSHYRARYWMEMKGQRVKRHGSERHTWNTQKGYELWCAGHTDQKIAEVVGVHQETIRTYRIKNWGESNAKRQMTWDTEKGLELFRQGMTPYKIARELGTSKQNVMSYARKHWEGER